MFMFGGMVLDSTSGIPQAAKTPGQGVWSYLGGNNFRVSFGSFGFDSTGKFTGYTKITHSGTIDPHGTEISSSGIAQVFNLNGKLVATLCSSSTGTPFQ